VSNTEWGARPSDTRFVPSLAELKIDCARSVGYQKNIPAFRKTEILMLLPESKHDKKRLEVELEGLREENEHMKVARGELGYKVEG
jgi:hypothetical protein